MTHSTRPIALITGASRGLGRAAALALAAQGYDLVLTYQRNHDDAMALVNEVRFHGATAIALAFDSRHVDQIPSFVVTLSQQLQHHFAGRKLDALVNNAGVGSFNTFSNTSAEQLDLMFTIHVKAVWLLTQALLDHLNDGSSIVTISSGLTRFSLPGYAAYAAAKGAVEVMTRYLAQELGPRQIRVNVLAPGAIATDFGGGVVRDNPDVNQLIAQQTALGRVGMPEDIGAAIALLLSPAAHWINGQRIEASGGIHL